ncbi:MAG: hypothetical protein ACRYFK_07510 [Janthinobacterium lividum]
MNLADIRAWLASGQDFAQGVAFYALVGTSDTYARLFGLGPSEYSRGVLARELAALVATPAEPTAAEPTAAQASPAQATPAHSSPGQPSAAQPTPAQATAVREELLAELRQVRDERSHVHPQLTARGTGQQRRRDLAASIVRFTHREVALQALLAHVAAHGRLPGPVPLEEVAEAGELQRRLLNLRSRRSKLKKDPARAADLAQVEADIELITQKLHL